ncbi:protein phosphatase 2C domain-containing protein [Streptomyces xinghaiensis]|uniref:protein phosphatase 2C domain-containing protein n=1 Tax=Streptomyces xinghaiensis TaxID=1038928 RepID=UPI001EE07BA2|nr:protein phosphatase 2C domain-containing protein [Streptomyces xinghaiensis]
MSQYGERNSHEDAWWRELYGEEKPDAGPAAADDSLDDRFDSASRAVGPPSAGPGPAPERPGREGPAGGDPRSGWFAARGFSHGGPPAPGHDGGPPPGRVEEPVTGPGTGVTGAGTGTADSTGTGTADGTGAADRVEAEAGTGGAAGDNAARMEAGSGPADPGAGPRGLVTGPGTADGSRTADGSGTAAWAEADARAAAGDPAAQPDAGAEVTDAGATGTGHRAGDTGHWAGTGGGPRAGRTSTGDRTEPEAGAAAGGPAAHLDATDEPADADDAADAGTDVPAPAEFAAPEQWTEPPRPQDPPPRRETGEAGHGGPGDTAAASPPSAEPAPDEWWFSTPATPWPAAGPAVSGDRAEPSGSPAAPPHSPPSAPGPGAPWQPPGTASGPARPFTGAAGPAAPPSSTPPSSAPPSGGSPTTADGRSGPAVPGGEPEPGPESPEPPAGLPAAAPTPRNARPMRSMTPPRAPWEPPLDPSDPWDPEEAATGGPVEERQSSTSSSTAPYGRTGRPYHATETGPESGAESRPDGGSAATGGAAPGPYDPVVPLWREQRTERTEQTERTGPDTRNTTQDTQETQNDQSARSTPAGTPADPGPVRTGAVARTDGGHVAVGMLRRGGDEAAGDGGRYGGPVGAGSTGAVSSGAGSTGGGVRAGVEPGYVGERPPTYQGEPTALPEADPKDLDDLVPDTVLDGARYGTMTLRAASLRGDSARYRGEPRRDALLTARFGRGDQALLLIATATGGRAAEDGHRAAADVCRWVAEAVGRAHVRLAEDIREGRRGALKSGLHRLTGRSYGKLRARAAELGLQPAAYTSGLRCLLLPVDPACRTRVFFGVGGGGLFRLRDGEWQDLEPSVPAQPQAADGSPAGSGAVLPGQGGGPRGPAAAGPEPAGPAPAGSAPAVPPGGEGTGRPPGGGEAGGADRPSGPAGDRLTVDLGTRAPGRPGAPGDPGAASFRFRASVARPGDTLLLCSAGLADPLRGEPALAGLLAARWAVSPAPGLAAFLSDVQLRVKGYADDRTAAAVWED